MQALLEKLSHVKEIAYIAYYHAEKAESLGQRREFERLGIRATDLVLEISSYISRQL